MNETTSLPTPGWLGRGIRADLPLSEVEIDSEMRSRHPNRPMQRTTRCFRHLLFSSERKY